MDFSLQTFIIGELLISKAENDLALTLFTAS